MKLQRSLIKFVCIFAFWAMLAHTAAARITIDTVLVDNPGNPNDTTQHGAVGYDYRIGKYEVTLDQYCAFLNAVGKTDTYALYNPNLAVNARIAGISRSGLSGSYTYSVIGSGNRPVTLVSWFDAARFANWLQNGQPTGAQGAGTTETGAYTLNGATSGVFLRSPGATYSLPSENEWYKAAYYDPSLNAGSGGYWDYSTRSNVQPNSRNGSASDPNSANYYYDDGMANGYNGGYAVNNSTAFPTGNALTDVGAFSLAVSFYGTFDQSGNVQEWNDAVLDLPFGPERGVRGGSWFVPAIDASSSSYYDPSNENTDMGFRVVMVPEPTMGVMVVVGMVLLAWKWKCAR